jgi:hypothetical protein
MSGKTRFAISVFVCGVIGLAVVFGQSSAPITGQWTIVGPVIRDHVQLETRRTSSKGTMSSSSPVPMNQLRGLTQAQLESTGTVVRFDVVRDAGTLQFQGYVQNSSGGGTFSFSPNLNFEGEMRSLGYAGLTEEKLFVFAMHDISTAYVREMNALGIRPESTDQLVTMRIHNVSVEYVKELSGLGYTDLSPAKLVTMQIHDVTTDFARELKSLGYNAVSPEQMVTMRIHQVSTDFIKEVESLGYGHPQIEQLVTMRIHNVTPDYIRKTRSLGLGNLTIDQLVRTKIHNLVN